MGERTSRVRVRAMRHVANIWQTFDDGYFVCVENCAHGRCRMGVVEVFDTKAAALRGASRDGFTHAMGVGTYWEGTRKIPKQYRDRVAT